MAAGSRSRNSFHGVMMTRAWAPVQASRAEAVETSLGWHSGRALTAGSYTRTTNGARSARSASEGEFLVEVLAVGQPGPHHPGVGTMGIREPAYRVEIPLEIAACDTEAGSEVGVGSNPTVESERRRDLAPVGADPLAQLGEGVRGRDGGDQAHVDGDLRQLRALIPHRQDRAPELPEERGEGGGKWGLRVGATQDEALWGERAFDRSPEHERFDLVERSARGEPEASGEAGGNLAQHYQHRGRSQMPDHLVDQRPDRPEIAGSDSVGGDIGGDVEEVAAAEVARLGREGQAPAVPGQEFG